MKWNIKYDNCFAFVTFLLMVFYFELSYRFLSNLTWLIIMGAAIYFKGPSLPFVFLYQSKKLINSNQPGVVCVWCVCVCGGGRVGERDTPHNKS